MATSPSLSPISSSALLSLVVLILVSSSSSCFISATAFSYSDHKPNTNPVGFTARLVHRDSPESPFYDPKLTDAETKRNEEERSIERYNLLARRPNDVRAPVTYNSFAYMISFGVGTPPVDTYAIMDTGSDITWISCKPCDNCFTRDQKVSIFDPSKSSSYVKIGCEDPFCSGYIHGSLACDKDGIYCRYGQSYMDGTLSTGVLSIDNFSFLDGTRPRGKMLQLAFGCGHYINKPNIQGVFGLNKQALSILAQKGIDRFSHCFMPIGYKQTTLLRFGQDAIITNETTPMVEFGDKHLPGYYYVSLEGISVGDTRLNIPQGTFNTSETGDRGVIIDSGTTKTFFARDAYDLLLAEVKKQIIRLRMEKLPNYELCYRVTTMQQLINGLPKITYHFSGLNHTLPVWNAWTPAIMDEEGITACLMFKRATLDLTIIGFENLQNVNVGYDLRNKVISLESGDCAED